MVGMVISDTGRDTGDSARDGVRIKELDRWTQNEGLSNVELNWLTHVVPRR